MGNNKFRILFKSVVWPSVLMTAVGCSSASVRVDSEPAGADVALSISGQPARLLGKTPYTADAAMLNNSESAQIVVTKPGFKTESILIPPTTFAKSSAVFVKLEANPDAPSCTVQEEALQRVGRGVAEAQAAIRMKNYDQAETLLKSLASQYTTLAVLQDLVGNVYYLKRDFDRALAAYRRSNELSPNNPETVRMIKKLEELKGAPQ